MGLVLHTITHPGDSVQWATLRCCRLACLLLVHIAYAGSKLFVTAGLRIHAGLSATAARNAR